MKHVYRPGCCDFPADEYNIHVQPDPLPSPEPMPVDLARKWLQVEAPNSGYDELEFEATRHFQAREIIRGLLATVEHLQQQIGEQWRQLDNADVAIGQGYCSSHDDNGHIQAIEELRAALSNTTKELLSLRGQQQALEAKWRADRIALNIAASQLAPDDYSKPCWEGQAVGRADCADELVALSVSGATPIE